MDLRCKNLNLFGKTMLVNGTVYSVPADGEDKGIVRGVAEGDAMKLLQNLRSWVPLHGPGVAKAKKPKPKPRSESKPKRRRGRRTEETTSEKPADESGAETEDEPKKPGVMSRLFGSRSDDSSDEGKEE